MSFFEDFLSDPTKFYSFLGAAAAVSVPLIVNTCKDLYFDYQKKKTERNYITVQLIFLLDEFVFSCSEVSWDQGYDPTCPEPDIHDYEPQTVVPIFDMSSIKGEHKYLAPLVLYKLQNINVEIAKSKESLRSITNHPNFDYDQVLGYYKSRRKNFAEIGIYASDISDQLRASFKIPYRDDWNPREYIVSSINNMKREESRTALIRMEKRAQRAMTKERERLLNLVEKTH